MKTQELTYRDAKILIGIIDEEVDDLIIQLSNFELYKTEYQEIHLSKRQKEFLGVRILLNKLLEREVQVAYNEDNKPYLKDKTAYISITHSKNYIAVMAHTDYGVGIDLELRTNKVERVATRFLSEVEKRYFQDDIAKIEVAWSTKEALYKVIGKKAINFADSFEILPFQMNDLGDLFVLYTLGSRIFTVRYLQNDTFTIAFLVDKKLKI